MAGKENNQGRARMTNKGIIKYHTRRMLVIKQITSKEQLDALAGMEANGETFTVEITITRKRENKPESD